MGLENKNDIPLIVHVRFEYGPKSKNVSEQFVSLKLGTSTVEILLFESLAIVENSSRYFNLGLIIIPRSTILLEYLLINFFIIFILFKQKFGFFRIVFDLWNLKDEFIESLSFGKVCEFQGFVTGEYFLFIDDNLTVGAFRGFQASI